MLLVDRVKVSYLVHRFLFRNDNFSASVSVLSPSEEAEIQKAVDRASPEDRDGDGMK